MSSVQVGPGAVDDQTRTLLQSQGVQPIIPIDTSWLAVGHIDEILTFVPSPENASNGRNVKLVMADTDIMRRLLRWTMHYTPEGHGRTHFHRGRYRVQPTPIKSTIEKSKNKYPALKIPFAKKIAVAWGKKENAKRSATDAEAIIQNIWEEAVSTKVQKRFLNPIKERLCHCIGLNDQKDVLRLPVCFQRRDPLRGDAPWGEAFADTPIPNVVNMQVLNTNQGTHLLVPRPCGPRLPPDEAETVVQRVLATPGQQYPEVDLPQSHKNDQPGFPFWAWPGLDARTLALFFTREKLNPEGGRMWVTKKDRLDMITVLKNESKYTDLSEQLQRAVEATQANILAHNDGARDLLDGNGEFKEWYRLFIPENSVDVIEAYTQSVLQRIGCQVHFVDAWYYHTNMGSVHCGTNVRHEPPSPDSQAGPPPWWQTYPDLATADTIYDPKNNAYREPPPRSTTWLPTSELLRLILGGYGASPTSAERSNVARSPCDRSIYGDRLRIRRGHPESGLVNPFVTVH